MGCKHLRLCTICSGFLAAFSVISTGLHRLFWVWLFCRLGRVWGFGNVDFADFDALTLKVSGIADLLRAYCLGSRARQVSGSGREEGAAHDVMRIAL